MYCLQCGKKIKIGETCPQCENNKSSTSFASSSSFIGTQSPAKHSLQKEESGFRDISFASIEVEAEVNNENGRSFKLRDIDKVGGVSYARRRNSNYSLKDFRKESRDKTRHDVS